MLDIQVNDLHLIVRKLKFRKDGNLFAQSQIILKTHFRGNGGMAINHMLHLACH